MTHETTRSRFRKVLAGEAPSDRLPIIEWAGWWDLTIQRWREEGLPADLDVIGVKRYFDLDINHQLWFPDILLPPKLTTKRHIENEADYEALLPHIYPDPVPYDRDAWRLCAAEQKAGDAIIWLTLSGFFWWPRVLLGIEAHLFAFYDQPDLMRRINQDMVRYHLRCIDDFCSNVCVPDFMTFAEDMSYNHGPMISKELFDEFMAPYYRQVIPRLKEYGIVPLIDSDGDIAPLIPWFQEVGLEGILPLERMAGVDINRIRANHPKWKMIGGFDKTVMHLGEKAIRAEFERILPTMRSGGYIPSVDHQTPPAVSIDDYRLYLRLLREYAAKAIGL
ncbi:MAG: uroporphyrinogen decarboxylase family protein [Armatimonadota bacterium]|nr:uroporphyrinogen decarboxylase family protein [Armatimonadota bacterium]